MPASEEEDCIGQIVLPNGTKATLKKTGQWECEDQNLQSYLSMHFRLGDHSDLGMEPGWGTVAAAACELNGRAEYPHGLRPLGEGEVS